MHEQFEVKIRKASAHEVKKNEEKTLCNKGIDLYLGSSMYNDANILKERVKKLNTEL